MASISRNAATARLGFLAEEILTEKPAVREAFTTYFKRPINTITKAPPGKKTDILINFQDGSVTRLQNKNGDNQRGFSVDRRDCENLTAVAEAQELIKNVCLHKGELRPEVSKEEALKIVEHSFLGDEPDWQPEYVTHTQMWDGQLVHLSIIPMSEFVQILKGELFDTLLPKKTCVHLSPSIYLQRKGGGKTDKRPDQIQTKWKQGKIVNQKFTKLI